ncbi:hypothetical protein B0H10DRAFT_2219151 [Mycena sp. CBHHK59/15]|nr:hypothetical protein B0H10DRAFT_2219151 [Mycena sp. CBHHK59/15]
MTFLAFLGFSDDPWALTARTDQTGKQGKAPPSSFLIVSPHLHSSTTPATTYDQQAQQVQQASDDKNDCGQTSCARWAGPFTTAYDQQAQQVQQASDDKNNCSQPSCRLQG